MREIVEPELAALRQEVSFPVEGGSLRVEVYEPKAAHTSLLLLHGFIESAEKFREMIWYFVRAGYAVYAPDQRGHGGSVRSVPENSVTHIDRFAQYVDDAEKLTREVILKKNSDRRLVLYAHSMGGAVAAFLLARVDCFACAALSSPMIAPSSAPLPMWMGKMMAGTILGGKD